MLQADSSHRLLLFRERFECLEDSVGAGIHPDRRQVAPCNRPLRIDYKQRSLTDSLVIAIRAVLACDRTLGLEIRQQRKVQLAILRERIMAPGAIDRDTYDRSLEFVELGQHLIVKRHLIAAHRTPVGRIECHDQWSAAEVTQRDELIGRAMQRKVRRRGTGSEYLVRG